MNHGNPKLASLVDTAIEAIGALLTDPATPPAARLRAAKFILEAVPNHRTPHSQQSAKPAAPATHAATPRPAPKIGRNDYCPCGSGLKYKKCCLEHRSPSSFTAGRQPAADCQMASRPHPAQPA